LLLVIKVSRVAESCNGVSYFESLLQNEVVIHGITDPLESFFNGILF
jgi:hypothetical protein